MNQRFIHEETSTVEKALILSTNLGLIRQQIPFPCTVCNNNMNFERGHNRHAVNGRFKCGNRNCRKTISLYKNTIFHNIKISFKDFFDLLYNYAARQTISETISEIDITRKTICFWHEKFDSIILEFGEHFVTEKIGGNNQVVEVDEALLFKRKANVERILAGQRFWVFGAIDRLTKAVKLKLTLRRRIQDCTNFLIENVHLTSKIYSDCWRGYNSVGTVFSSHETVNHTQNFVDPLNNEIHTNTIERLWRSLRKFVRGYNSLDDLKKQCKIFEILYTLKIKTAAQKFDFLIECIKLKYPIN